MEPILNFGEWVNESFSTRSALIGLGYTFKTSNDTGEEYINYPGFSTNIDAEYISKDEVVQMLKHPKYKGKFIFMNDRANITWCKLVDEESAIDLFDEACDIIAKREPLNVLVRKEERDRANIMELVDETNQKTVIAVNGPSKRFRLSHDSEKERRLKIILDFVTKGEHDEHRSGYSSMGSIL